MISYLQAVVIGLLQGVTELFPISSLGHSVLVPAWIGGSWEALVTDQSTASSDASPYLAFVVALHVATALALVAFFFSDWVRIIRGFFRTIKPSISARTLVTRDSEERLAWLLIVGTIPVGVLGLLLEHTFRTVFAKPLAAAIFLTVNGLILFTGEYLRRKAPVAPEDESPRGRHADRGQVSTAPARTLDTLEYREAGLIGVFQTVALLAGISRSGITMVGGLARGLSHKDAARFSFLLATPVILAAGVLKLPSLAGPAGDGIHGQIIVGFLASGIAAFISVRFLTKYFETRTLTPFALYCLIAGVASIVRFAVF